MPRFDDWLDPNRGQADVLEGARRVRRHGCDCAGCRPLYCFGTLIVFPFDHQDDLWPVYGPPEPHQPRRAEA